MATKSNHMDDASCKLMADLFSVFANKTRMNMFCILSQGRKTVTELSEETGVSLQNASQHLRVMRDKGVVITEKSNQNIFYSITDDNLMQGLSKIRSALADRMAKIAGTVKKFK
jgi:DNA-binding transcriptional ArsR family regulator